MKGLKLWRLELVVVPTRQCHARAPARDAAGKESPCSSAVHVKCDALPKRLNGRVNSRTERNVMKLRNLCLATATALTLMGTNDMITSAAAQDVDIYLNIPGFGSIPGYEYGGRRYISCRHGARIVDRRGFNRVSPIECNRPVYRYKARRGGIWWIVRLDARDGRIRSERPL
jgi:hypothetical protein